MNTPQQSAKQLTLAGLSLWAVGYALRRWTALTGVLGTQLLRVGLDLLKPWPMVFLVDYILRQRPMPAWLQSFVETLPGPHTPMAYAGWSVGATIAIFLLSWAVGVAVTYGNINLGQRLTYDLAGDLFAKLQQLSLHFHARKSVGDNIRRVTADCSCVSVIVKDALLPVFAAIVSLVSMFIILWKLESSLALLALVVVPWMLFVFKRYAAPMMHLSYEQQDAEGKIYEVVEQTLSAIPVVQAFNREEKNERWFAGIVQDAMGATVSLTYVQVKFKVLMGLATAVGTAAVLLFGTKSALEGGLTVGGILAFLSYIGSLYAPLEAIMYTNATIQAAGGSARRVLDVLRMDVLVKDKPGAHALERPRGAIQMDSVTFGYETGRPVLRDIRLEVEPGQTVAIVGPTGSGKSTLVSLIPRFFDPWQGRVLFDGHDLRDLRLKSLRSQVSLVLQDSFLFPISIAENIAYGRPDASHEEIVEAARAANAHEFIERLPQGYNTIAAERGGTLSGGERQRISIARALLRKAPILILDEPTSALDSQTERALIDALSHLTRDRTTFIIAHRISTIQAADRIIVLRDGQIEESGTHHELLRTGRTYARFYQLHSGNKTVDVAEELK